MKKLLLSRESRYNYYLSELTLIDFLKLRRSAAKSQLKHGLEPRVRGETHEQTLIIYLSAELTSKHNFRLAVNNACVRTCSASTNFPVGMSARLWT